MKPKKQYTDFSVHFSLENQTIDEINEKLDKWMGENNSNCEYFDLSEPWEMERTPVLHHCFQPYEEFEKSNSNLCYDVYDDFIMSLSEETVCWYYAAQNMNAQGLQKLWGSRYAMLRNLQRIGGVAIFIGSLDSKDIASEYEIATKYVKDLNIVVIP